MVIQDIFAQFQNYYAELKGFLPAFLQPYFPWIVLLIVLHSILEVIKRNLIFIVLLVLLVPASIPVLVNIADYVLNFIKSAL